MDAICTLVDLLAKQATVLHDVIAFTFSSDAHSREERITFAQLHLASCAIAAGLKESDPAGQRVLLLYPPGLEFIKAFFGCLYAGAVAVPVYPPHPVKPAKALHRLERIIADSKPKFILTTRPIMQALQADMSACDQTQDLSFIATEVLPNFQGDQEKLALCSETVAMLQYTSGSTGDPKGVVLTHGNLLHNVRQIELGLGRPAKVSFSWLPMYHDMGLIGHVIAPVFFGIHSVIMSPLEFLQSPYLWLRGITKYRATTSGAPNFAWDFCTRKINDERLRSLDLSSWHTAYNGSEPIRADTLRTFAKKFARCGFRQDSFLPCYGLAESSLMVSGGKGEHGFIVRSVDAEELDTAGFARAPQEGRRSKELVSCGRPIGDARLSIVDPNTCAPVPTNRVGEIWVSSPSVGLGYWDNPQTTKESFQANLVYEAATFLRTGDLGFFDEYGDIFITGRLKDVIIVDGRNVYPQDVERAAEQSHPAIRAGAVAAFGVNVQASERVVLVVEMMSLRRESEDSRSNAIRAIRVAVQAKCDVALHAVLLVARGTVPRGSSGKLRRHACRTLFLEGKLKTLAADPASSPERRARLRDGSSLRDWLVETVAKHLGISPEAVDARRPLADHGFSSRDIAEFAGELSDRLGHFPSPTLLWQYPTLDALTEHLSNESPDSQGDRRGVATSDEAIAIIGIGCRFPGADGPSNFWKLLRAGKDAIAEIPLSRWDSDQVDTSPSENARISRGGFIDQIDRFDAEFFRISPREASGMDPQQRLLLEVAWEALEDGGQSFEALAGSQTGVFIGASGCDYGYLQLAETRHSDPHSATGSSPSVLAGRLSYAFDLRGPSVTVDTACSSSLVAIHLACESLRRGESALALAGGVNLILLPHVSLHLNKAGLLSPDGRCKAFSAAADGYVRSEGVGVVILKPLSRAIADRDPIVALVKSTAVAHDGRTNGLTAPSPDAQRELLRNAYERAGVSPACVQFVEAHGTGTKVGDLIEVTALGEALGRSRAKPCAIGSVKSNIGHLEAAAGIAGFIKVALALQHAELPPTLHATPLNPDISFEELSMAPQLRLETWLDEPRPRLAGVSSFGFGGTIAHAVLQEAVSFRAEVSSVAGRICLLPISARHPEVLPEVARRYATLLGQLPDENLEMIADNAARRRSHHEFRAAVVGRSAAAMATALHEFAEHQSRSTIAHGTAINHNRKIAFVFPGQGSQWRGMARSLVDKEPIFRKALERLDQSMRPHLVRPLVDLLPLDFDQAPIEIVQPVLFSLAVALAELWRYRGIEPSAVVGHSLGEIAASHVAGVLSLDDAARVVCVRSRLLAQQSSSGGMLAAELTPDEAAQKICGTGLSVAALNGPRTTILSGPAHAIKQFSNRLTNEGIFCRSIAVDVASHCALMDPLLRPIQEALQSIAPGPGDVPFVSTVTGARLEGTQLTAQYWARNLRDPVLFAPVIRKLRDQGFGTFVEISAHPILMHDIVETCAEDPTHPSVSTVASLRRGRDEEESLLESLAALHVRGHRIAWEHVHHAHSAIRLPMYPWHRDRFWIEPSREHRGVSSGGNGFTLLQDGAFVWESILSLGARPYLADHRIDGEAVVSMAEIMELVSRAARAWTSQVLRFEKVRLPRMMTLNSDRRVQVLITSGDKDRATFELRSLRVGEHSADSTVHASGMLTPSSREQSYEPLSSLRTRIAHPVMPRSLYDDMERMGIQYGSSRRILIEIWCGHQEALGRIALDSTLTMADAHAIALDAALQLAGVCLGASAAHPIFLPISADAFAAAWDSGEASWVHASARPGGELLIDARVLNESGVPLATLVGVRLCRIEKPFPAPEHHPYFRVQWIPLDLPPSSAESKQHWLIVPDASGIADAVAQELTKRGDVCEVAPVEIGLEDTLPGRLNTSFSGCTNVLYLRTLDSVSNPSSQQLSDIQNHGCLGAMRLAQSLAKFDELGRPPRLWIVTCGTRSVQSGDTVDCTMSPVWGLARSLAHEHGSLRCTCIDIDRATRAKELADELHAGGIDDQVALRGATRYVARLERYTLSNSGEATICVENLETEPFALASHRPGTFDALRWTAAARSTPGPGQVEIAVRAAGINFRDVLLALGECPGVDSAKPCRFDAECAGVITSVGEGITNFSAGDIVVTIAAGSLGSHACVDARHVRRRPEGMGSYEAAAVPIAFGTASYALSHLARLKKGERVLIHSATGGVGLAAVHIAQAIGAEILATAGSQAKRDWLAGRGVKYVFNSRTTAFADEVLAATGGEGVDVVLNSLAGEFLTRSIETLRPFGRFIEIGKRDIYGERTLPLSRFRRNLTFSAVDLIDLIETRAEFFFEEVLGEVWRAIESGKLEPLPVTVVPADHVEDAFRHLAMAKHIGKVVLSFESPVQVQKEGRAPLRFDSHGTYLLTGGHGGVGLEVAGWMIDRGVRNLAIISRANPSEAARSKLEAMILRGARIMVERADVSDEGEVISLLSRLDASMPPLRGIIHAAGILDDAMLLEQDAERFLSVMKPKLGAWNLHRLTLGRPLEFFVLFSSAASLLGSPGQTNYAAANAFLDALAEHRIALGLPALSLQWGPWSEVGLAATSGKRATRLDRNGVRSWQTREALDHLERAMQCHSGVLGAIAIDARELVRHQPALAQAPFFAPLLADLKTGPTEPQEERLIDLLRATSRRQERRRLLESYLRDQLSAVTRQLPSNMDRTSPLTNFGLDSILALELRNRIERGLDIRLSATLVWAYPTIYDLATYLAGRLDIELDEPLSTKLSASSPSPVQARAIVEAVEVISDAEAVRILTRE
jgi:acyl transferase domain-containing protein/acyl-CoA synthetase (AMP-forming)/AMP-acid ligase II/acyl carrier protein